MSTVQAAPQVYISFSQQDKDWFNRIAEGMLKQGLQLLHQLQIPEADRSERSRALLTSMWNAADLAVILVSDAWLNSINIDGAELRYLLGRREGGLWVVPILIKPAEWRSNDFLRTTQMLPRSVRPLSELPEDHVEGAIDEIVREIVPLLAGKSSGEQPPRNKRDQPEPPRDAVPLDYLQTFELTQLTQAVVDEAQRSMQTVQMPVALSTSSLLFAATAVRSVNVESDDIGVEPVVLALGRVGIRLEDVRKAYFDAHRGDPSLSVAPKVMTVKAASVFAQAARIALLTSGQRRSAADGGGPEPRVLLRLAAMCGRFNLRNPKDIIERFGFMDWSDKRIEPRFNIAPSQEILTIVQLPLEGPTVQTAVWGLKPAGVDRSLINVRAESLGSSAIARGAQRCLIPASGFYEWRNRQPMHIRRRDDRPFAFAGLWLPGQVPTAAILTVRPNELMATIHNRMPAILRPDDELRWLDPTSNPRELLEPIDSHELDAYAVKPLVNSWANEGSELIAPAEPMPQQLELLQ